MEKAWNGGALRLFPEQMGAGPTAVSTTQTDITEHCQT